MPNMYRWMYFYGNGLKKKKKNLVCELLDASLILPYSFHCFTALLLLQLHFILQFPHLKIAEKNKIKPQKVSDYLMRKFQHPPKQRYIFFRIWLRPS